MKKVKHLNNHHLIIHTIFFLQDWLPNQSSKELILPYNLFAQSAGAVEYTDCTSAEG